MDPLLTYMCKRYAQYPSIAKQYGKMLDVAFILAFMDLGLARLMKENGQPIWKATKKLVRDVGPELGRLQPSPAPDCEPEDWGRLWERKR
jgi:hypothetical protein